MRAWINLAASLLLAVAAGASIERWSLAVAIPLLLTAILFADCGRMVAESEAALREFERRRKRLEEQLSHECRRSNGKII